MDQWNNLEKILKRLMETDGQGLISERPQEFGGGRLAEVPPDLMFAIGDLPEVGLRRDMLMRIGPSSYPLNPRIIGEALILRSFRTSCQQGLSELGDFLRTNVTGYSEIVLLGGISVSERIDLGNGFYICPPEDVPIEEFRRKHLEAKTREPHSIFSKFDVSDTRVVGAALIGEGLTYSTFVREEELPSAALRASPIPLLLTLIGPSSPVTYRLFFELDDSAFLKEVADPGYISSLEETRVTHHAQVERSHFEGFGEIVEKFSRLPENERNHLHVSLHRLNESIRHRNPVDKALDLGIALESLLLSGRKEKEQLALQFRLRGAWLLGSDGVHRTALYKQFRELYELRSLAAHNGTITSRKGANASEALVDGQRLCAKAIKKVILRGGYPDWDALLVGANYVIQPERGD